MKQDKIKQGVVVGLIAGAAIAAVLAAIATVLWLLPGESDIDRSGAGIVVVLLSYFVAGVIGGPLAGLLWGITSGRLPGAVIGFAVALIFGGALALGISVQGGSVKSNVAAALLLAVLLGAPVGHAVARDLRRRN